MKVLHDFLDFGLPCGPFPPVLDIFCLILWPSETRKPGKCACPTQLVLPGVLSCCARHPPAAGPVPPLGMRPCHGSLQGRGQLFLHCSLLTALESLLTCDLKFLHKFWGKTVISVALCSLCIKKKNTGDGAC